MISLKKYLGIIILISAFLSVLTAGDLLKNHARTTLLRNLAKEEKEVLITAIQKDSRRLHLSYVEAIGLEWDRILIYADQKDRKKYGRRCYVVSRWAFDYLKERPELLKTHSNSKEKP